MPLFTVIVTSTEILMKGKKITNGKLKFYADVWEPIQPDLLGEKERLIKPGWTIYSDAKDRYDEELNPNYNIAALKKYFKLKKIGFSVVREASVIKKMEKDFLFKFFPVATHKVWMENKFKIEDNRALDNTGVSEFRVLSAKEWYDLCQTFYEGAPGLFFEYRLTEEEKKKKYWAKEKIKEGKNEQ